MFFQTRPSSFPKIASTLILKRMTSGLLSVVGEGFFFSSYLEQCDRCCRRSGAWGRPRCGT
jgi:hypothetical protein